MRRVAPERVALAASDQGDISWTRFGDFRARLSTAGVIGAPSVKLGDRVDLRSDDARLTWESYRLLRCGFTASEGDIRYHRSNDACDGENASSAVMHSRHVIDRLLADLRASAGSMGSSTVEDVRCYGAVDGYRVWCEAVAVVPAAMQSTRR